MNGVLAFGVPYATKAQKLQKLQKLDKQLIIIEVKVIVCV